MQLVAARDPAAERELASRLAGRVRRMSRTILRSDADSDDAAQLGLLEVLKSAKSYRGESSIERWADRIAVRTAMRIARERRRNDPLDEEAPEELAAPAPDQSELQRPIADYLARLSEERRTVLVMRHALDHSVAEIAELTGVSVNTVKDRLLTARRQIRRMIRQDDVLAEARLASQRR
jgi:RNA polymerase sigma-70 factor (ECF subfamily)